MSRGWEFPCLSHIPPYSRRVKSGINTEISNPRYPMKFYFLRDFTCTLLRSIISSGLGSLYISGSLSHHKSHKYLQLSNIAVLCYCHVGITHTSLVSISIEIFGLRSVTRGRYTLVVGEGVGVSFESGNAQGLYRVHYQSALCAPSLPFLPRKNERLSVWAWFGRGLLTYQTSAPTTELFLTSDNNYMDV